MLEQMELWRPIFLKAMEDDPDAERNLSMRESNYLRLRKLVRGY
jgi:hypothetical protein